METQRHWRANQFLRTQVPKLTWTCLPKMINEGNMLWRFCPHKAYHVNSYTQDRKAAIIKHIKKVRSGQKWRTWQGAKQVCLTRNRVPPDKPRGTPPPLPPCPDQIPISISTSPLTRVEIPTNNANDIGIQSFHQSDASILQQYIAGEKINFTAPDPENISQVKYSKSKARKN